MVHRSTGVSARFHGGHASSPDALIAKGIHSSLLAVEFDRGVRAIAKRLVLRCTATANRHSIADLVLEAIR